MKRQNIQESDSGLEYVDRLSSGYQMAQIVLSANRLGVFDVVGETSRSSAEIAASLACSERGTRILCDALVALDLLEKKENRYSNSPLSRRLLTQNSVESKRNRLLHAAVQYERWAGLAEAVRTGGRVPDERIDPSLRAGKRDFALAMADTGRQMAGDTVAALDLEQASRILDIGGGPGIYAIEFASRHPHLEVVILDDAETLDVARENVEAAGLSDRITLRPGDAFSDDWGAAYDLLFLSNLVHIYSPEENRCLLRKCRETLRPGGRVCIKDFILEADRTSPASAALFAVNMLVSTDGGDCYTLGDVGSWFRESGLQMEKTVALTAQTRLVVGVKVA